MRPRRDPSHARLDPRIRDDSKRIRIKRRQKILRHVTALIRFQEVIVKTHLGLERRRLGYPMERPLDFPSGGRAALL